MECAARGPNVALRAFMLALRESVLTPGDSVLTHGETMRHALQVDGSRGKSGSGWCNSPWRWCNSPWGGDNSNAERAMCGPYI